MWTIITIYPTPATITYSNHHHNVLFYVKIARRAIKFDTNTEGDNEFNFDDPWDFPVMSPASQSFHLGCEIS